jgi:hypothetical protein
VVTLTPDAFAKLLRAIIETSDGRETGGPLLGYQCDEGNRHCGHRWAPRLVRRAGATDADAVDLRDEQGLELEPERESVCHSVFPSVSGWDRTAPLSVSQEPQHHCRRGAELVLFRS